MADEKPSRNPLNGALEQNGGIAKILRGLGIPTLVAAALFLYTVGRDVSTVSTQLHDNCIATQSINRQLHYIYRHNPRYRFVFWIDNC